MAMTLNPILVIKPAQNPGIPISSRSSIRYPDIRLSASSWYITNLFASTMRCPISGTNNMSTLPRCTTKTCKALLSIKYYVEHYIVTNKE
ncbi:hypothetical protein BPOR_0356g00080 [Botrytis porri]|uniref:Uncharacterized protein n=1 Tax=Botrytis porri TaxID=87229 RepID=A0A4Z1KSJ5_9HELO|nr:hypothetical protein BPOR_0356g00080 [Botrytis porri]